MKKRYYTVNIPSDAYDTQERGFELAVLAVKERMKMYYMPCNWYLVWIKGDEIRVCLETRIMTDYEYIGVVKDRLGSMPDIKTKPKKNYKQAHVTAEFLCKREKYGERGEVHVEIKEVKKK